LALQRFQEQAGPLLSAKPTLATASIKLGGESTTPAKLLRLAKLETIEVRKKISALRRSRATKHHRLAARRAF
jgi:hypothetical protein